MHDVVNIALSTFNNKTVAYILSNSCIYISLQYSTTESYQIHLDYKWYLHMLDFLWLHIIYKWWILYFLKKFQWTYSFTQLLRHALWNWEPFDFHHHWTQHSRGLLLQMSEHFFTGFTHFSHPFWKHLTQSL